jgi:hypothetical protein
MAFQTGTQIDPRLAIADYSGFARAGEIAGAGMAQAGQAIESGLNKYKENKKARKKEEAKINSAVATGESLIKLFGEESEFADVIADTLNINFGSQTTHDQRAAAADGFEKSITNMFLLQQKAQAPTLTPHPSGGAFYSQGGDTKFISPYAMSAGSGGTDANALIKALSDTNAEIAALEANK